MYLRFPIFQSHLDVAHNYWKQIVQPGDLVVDATCGNGHDTLRLSELALKNSFGKVWSLDIQDEALEKAQQLILAKLPKEIIDRVLFVKQSHSQFPVEIQNSSVKLIVYNLGYLPGGSKDITTKVETTLTSLRNAEQLIMSGGAISVTCYPGHAEGKKELEAIVEYVSKLSPQEWNCCRHEWINRKDAPVLLFLQRSLS